MLFNDKTPYDKMSKKWDKMSNATKSLTDKMPDMTKCQMDRMSKKWDKMPKIGNQGLGVKMDLTFSHLTLFVVKQQDYLFHRWGGLRHYFTLASCEKYSILASWCRYPYHGWGYDMPFPWPHARGKFASWQSYHYSITDEEGLSHFVGFIREVNCNHYPYHGWG